MSSYNLGAVVTLSTTITTPAGALTDPSTLTLTVTAPDGTPATYALGALVKDAVGTYHLDVVPAVAGHHTYRWVSTGTAAGATSGSFDVRPASPPRLASLGDLRSFARVPAADTSQDVELLAWLDAATGVVENITGPILRRTVVERHSGGRPSIVLRQRPVLAVQSVLEFLGNTSRSLTPLTDLGSTTDDSALLDLESGELVRMAGGGAGYAFAAGVQNVVVTYTAGYAVIPPAIQRAALIIAANLYQKTQLGGRPAWAGSGESMTDGPSLGGYAVPPLAAALLDPYVRMPGMA